MTTRRRSGLQAALAVLIFTGPAAPPADAAQAPPDPPARDSAAPAAPRPAPPRPVRIAPRAHEQSSYDFDGRVDTVTKDLTFETPPEYRESFAFWMDQMRGSSKSELINYVVLTRAPLGDGSVPFRRMVPRFQVEMMRDGKPTEPYGPLSKDVMTLAWEGSLDANGNVLELSRVAGTDNADIDELSFPMLDHLFPRMAQAREMAPGDSFTTEASMRMPARLTIRGLENQKVRMTREYVLRSIRKGQAEFDVTVSLAADPGTPPTVPRTTCGISGGGRGEATFDLQRGVFTKSRFPLRMLVDVEAPLRPLPGMDPKADPGTGKVRIEFLMTLAGSMRVSRLIGAAAPPVDPLLRTP